MEIDEIDGLMKRIEKNYSDFQTRVMGLDKQEIMEMAGRINAMNDAYMYLTEHHGFDYDQAKYLLKFANPLEVVADKWHERISDLSDMTFDLDKIFYEKAAEKKGYELARKGRAAASGKKPSIGDKLREGKKKSDEEKAKAPSPGPKKRAKEMD